MTQKLTKMEIDRIDLVDAGANGRRFALFKRDGGGPDEAEQRGLIAKIGDAVAKALGIPTPVEKAMTFAQIVAGREISTALEENWWVLQDALWSAIYATDDEGNDLTLDAKKALVGQNLDEFKAFLLERMDAGVEKSAGPSEVRMVAALVAKVGKKVSAARLARLKEAADALAGVLAEVEADDESAKTEKRANAQVAKEADVTPEELKAAVSEVVKAEIAPLRADVDELKKAKQPAEPVAKGDTPDPDDEVTLESVAKAVVAIADRMEAVEKQRGTRQSGSGEEATPVKKSDAKFAGFFN